MTCQRLARRHHRSESARYIEKAYRRIRGRRRWRSTFFCIVISVYHLTVSINYGLARFLRDFCLCNLYAASVLWRLFSSLATRDFPKGHRWFQAEQRGEKREDVYVANKRMLTNGFCCERWFCRTQGRGTNIQNNLLFVMVLVNGRWTTRTTLVWAVLQVPMGSKHPKSEFFHNMASAAGSWGAGPLESFGELGRRCDSYQARRTQMTRTARLGGLIVSR